jgi:hypothetical protein
MHTARVTTFNVKVSTEASIAQIGSDLCALNPDLCAFQELGAHWSMGAQLDQLRYLAAAQDHHASAWLPLLERAWSLDPYRGGPFSYENLSEGQPRSHRAGHFGVGLSAVGTFEDICFTYLPRVHDEQRGVV